MAALRSSCDFCSVGGSSVCNAIQGYSNNWQLFTCDDESLTSVTLKGIVEWLVTGSITPTSLLHCNSVKQAGGW